MSTDNTKKIEFIGSLPPIQSAILLDGYGDGGQIKLDIPRQHVGELVKLHSFGGKLLKVTIELEDNK